MDRHFKARLEARFAAQLTGPIRQRYDETEMRIAPGDVVSVISALHDEPDFHFQFLSDLAGVDTGEVAQELEIEIRLVVEGGDHRDDVTGRDPDLGLVMALPDRAGQLRGEAGLEARLEMAIHA